MFGKSREELMVRNEEISAMLDIESDPKKIAELKKEQKENRSSISRWNTAEQIGWTALECAAIGAGIMFGVWGVAKAIDVCGGSIESGDASGFGPSM